MNTTIGHTWLQRTGVVLVAAAGSVVLVAGCSSDSNGVPPALVTSSSSSAPAGGGGGGGGATESPIDQQSSVATGGGGGGSGSGFCKELTSANLSGLGTAKDLSGIVAGWDKLTADAPSDIKPDMQTIDDYLHAAAGGNPDPSKATDFATALQHVEVYVSQNCI